MKSVCFFFSGQRDEVPLLAVSLFDDSSHHYCSCSCSATCLIRKRGLKVLGRSSQSQGQPNNQRHFQACQVLTKAVRFMIFEFNKIDTFSKIVITILPCTTPGGKYTYLQLHKPGTSIFDNSSHKSQLNTINYQGCLFCFNFFIL